MKDNHISIFLLLLGGAITISATIFGEMKITAINKNIGSIEKEIQKKQEGNPHAAKRRAGICYFQISRKSSIVSRRLRERRELDK